ncbi:hypothetical protein CAEBREN_01329 [Caenorhabditis brenneri]|uniref:Uncharacterized protein n=1 Tax=Caenorhabditis brenneri TaxID=135651 RepID=G0PHE5_CAEBE|nr:hypothetical protein CAEBREN_01329 [Caenorhabditis brenneri]
MLCPHHNRENNLNIALLRIIVKKCYKTAVLIKKAEPGKSPLALLAKTCETIGLPEGSGSKKSASSSPQEKKDDASKIHHHHRSLMMDQQQSSTKQSSKSSPRSTPQSKEPTLTFPGLPKPSFPMSMPPMGFNPFFNPMMAAAAHYQMPMGFPGAFPMGPAGFAMGAAAANRMPCPFAMMRQPCQNPACLQCPSSSNAEKNGQMSAEMMAQFAAHPLFSMYDGMVPGVPNSSYQALLAVSASAAATSAATSPTDHSKKTLDVDAFKFCSEALQNSSSIFHIKNSPESYSKKIQVPV